MSPNSWIIALGITTGLLAFLLGIAAVKMFWRVDDKLEQLRKKAVRALPRLAAGGHTILVDMGEDVAVGDATDFIGKAEKGFDMLTDTAKVGPYFENVLVKELEVQLVPGNREFAAAIQKKVNELIAGFPKVPTVPA